MSALARRPAPPEWRGPMIRYDLVKEFVAVLVAVLLATILLAALFSSPDRKPVTIRSWADADPVDFLTTAATELDGSSTTAGYGHPYNSNGPGQNWGFIKPQQWFPVTHSIDPATDFVLGPLAGAGNPAFVSQVRDFVLASSDQRAAWLKAIESGLNKAVVSGQQVRLPTADYGAALPMLSSLLDMARSGALDNALLAGGQFYNTDYTQPLMFMGDGSYFPDLAQAEHLQGSQWGMMNETGSYPGQAWLWLYTLWYQVPPFSHSGNADLEIWLMMAVLTLVLILVPVIPGLRSVPRLIPVHRLIWRDAARQQ